MPRNTILKHHADSPAAKLERQFPRVERVASLVVDAIAVVKQSSSAKVLYDTGLIQQLVGATHICQMCRWVDRDDWDSIGDRLRNFLRSVRRKFKRCHEDWDKGELYVD